MTSSHAQERKAGTSLPSWEQIIAHASVGTCWVCGRSGFAKLSQHLALKHELPADHIRELAGLKWTQPLCTEEFSSLSSEKRRAQEFPVPRAVRHNGRGRRQAQTRAAMKDVANRANVKEALRLRNRSPEQVARRAEGLRRSPKAEQQRDAARAKRSRTMLTLDGKTQSVAAWAAELGVHSGTIRWRIRSGWPLERVLS